MKHEHSLTKRQLRARRVHHKIRGTTSRPRLLVHRSNRYLYAQIIDDDKGLTLVGVSEKELGKLEGTKTQRAIALGKLIVTKAKAKKVTQCAFDRGSCQYHGRIKAFGEAARVAGLKF